MYVKYASLNYRILSMSLIPNETNEKTAENHLQVLRVYINPYIFKQKRYYSIIVHSMSLKVKSFQHIMHKNQRAYHSWVSKIFSLRKLV